MCLQFHVLYWSVNMSQYLIETECLVKQKGAKLTCYDILPLFKISFRIYIFVSLSVSGIHLYIYMFVFLFTIRTIEGCPCLVMIVMKSCVTSIVGLWCFTTSFVTLIIVFDTNTPSQNLNPASIAMDIKPIKIIILKVFLHFNKILLCQRYLLFMWILFWSLLFFLIYF